MYLSRLILNPRNRKVQRDLANPYDLHRTVLSGFPQGKVHVTRSTEDAAGVLYRLDEDRQRLTLLVQSQQMPVWTSLPADYLFPADPFDPAGESLAVKQFAPQFSLGQHLQFRLRANPTKRMGKSAAKDPGKRVGIYKPEAQQAWLMRKAQMGGFKLLGLRMSDDEMQKGSIPRQDAPTLTLQLLAVRFDGLLEVTDPAAFVRTLTQGIGSGKAWGCGLLSLASVRG